MLPLLSPLSSQGVFAVHCSLHLWTPGQRAPCCSVSHIPFVPKPMVEIVRSSHNTSFYPPRVPSMFCLLSKRSLFLCLALCVCALALNVISGSWLQNVTMFQGPFSSRCPDLPLPNSSKMSSSFWGLLPAFWEHIFQPVKSLLCVV